MHLQSQARTETSVPGSEFPERPCRSPNASALEGPPMVAVVAAGGGALESVPGLTAQIPSGSGLGSLRESTPSPKRAVFRALRRTESQRTQSPHTRRSAMFGTLSPAGSLSSVLRVVSLKPVRGQKPRGRVLVPAQAQAPPGSPRGQVPWTNFMASMLIRRRVDARAQARSTSPNVTRSRSRITRPVTPVEAPGNHPGHPR